MGLFTRQPGDSLSRKRWDRLTDDERKRLFYRDQEREERAREKAERKHRKMVARAEKMERQREEWERKAKWLAARNKVEEEKRKRRQHSFLKQLARRI